ncbi:LysM peptidoglycan-binding domain-containing protein [Microbispora cellulosiformans]|uniref:LysM peptidoglycan-binding domain-containing protein n=1 Tax=Microbispora cellulosiformans TaxID=2614688 RepID=A0A5J5JUG3_9ACTN|nr:LysM peptidoglycan-binding domain-containing protein [Microbispora cellulosiformans]KAA9374855.1 LysM peptidoglycan-binding domain-containing protein [Microbispora cellulosiformans]
MTMYGLRHPILAKAAAIAVLTGLLAGIPAILLTFFWPVDLPTLDDLATPAEPVVIKTLLLATVWTCWALFAGAVIAELVATARARRGRVRMPFQRLAAYLITTITLATTAPVAASRGAIPAAAVAVTPAALPSHHLTAAEPKTSEPAKPYATYVVQPRDTLWTIADKQLGDPMRYREIVALNQGRTMDDGQTFTRGDWLRPGWTLRLPDDAARKEPRASQRTHTVRPGESLWEIAEQHLGDGTRYKEIFRLNRDRPQPGGARLTDPDVLESGWHLVLPERERDTRKADPTRHRAPSPLPTTTSATRPAHHDDVSPRPTADFSPQPRRSAVCSSVVVLPEGGIMAMSFAAGVAVALASARLRHRRRLPVPAVDEPLSVPAPEPQAPAVRALEQSHRRSFAESEDGPPEDFELVTSAFSIDPPLMLKAGIRGEEPVSLELSGLNLALIGPGAEDCVRAIVLDLLTQADQHRAEIVIPSQDAVRWFGEAITALIGHLPGLRLVATLDEAIDHLEEQFVARRRILRDHDTDDIPQLREAEPGEPLPALLLTACAADGHAYLDTLMSLGSTFGVGSVLIGRSSSGTTCEIDRDHRVAEATGTLAKELRDVTLFHMPANAAATVLQTLAAGNGMPADPTAKPTELEVPLPSTAPQPVRFAILGAPVIEVNGTPVDISGRAKALELFVLLAVHPKGLDREEICEHLWPDLEETLAGYRFHAALKDLRAALRGASGLGEKEASFVERSSKTYRIEAQCVDVDLWAFHRALVDARTAGNDEARTAALEVVAGLCRGRLCQGLKYDWLDQDHRWPLTVTSVKALLQLGVLHERAGRNERALEVYDQACALDPDMESAARSAIRLLIDLGRTDEARMRARHLKARLDALGVTCSSETQALLDRMNTASKPRVELQTPRA